VKAVRIKEYGGPEVMSYEDVDLPVPGVNEVLVKIEAIGINFIDTYQRSGLYQVPLPLTLGLEASGIVQETGDQATHFKIGDRVAYSGIPGAYAQYASVPEDRLVHIPDGISFNEGAAAMLQGMTAHFLSQSTYPLKNSDTCLIHAAAGGVGLLLTQMAKMASAHVIATVSTQEKADLALAAGADEIILYTESDFEEELKRITDGKGVNVVYDSVGKTTFEKSINCLKPRGYMVLYGNASGPVTEFNPATLAARGSLYLTRPTLVNYISDRESLDKRSGDIFRWIADGKLKLRIEHCFPLSEVKEAHNQLEGRITTGKVILLP